MAFWLVKKRLTGGYSSFGFSSLKILSNNIICSCVCVSHDNELVVSFA